MFESWHIVETLAEMPYGFISSQPVNIALSLTAFEEEPSEKEIEAEEEEL